MNKRILFLAFLTVLTCRVSFAQNGTYPWVIAYGLSGSQLTIGDDKFYKEYFRAKNWNILPSLHFKASRHVGYGFSPQATLSVGYAERRPQVDNKGGAFVDFDLNIKYSFANGYILKEKCFFDPYIVLGGGMNYVLGKVRGDVDLGLGTNIWIFKNFGVFIQASYNYVPHKFDASNPQDFRGYMHHTMGFVTRFGQGKDRDKDGVADIDDKCPDVPGLKALNGCPDTDGDGITDASDLCPLVPGLAAFAGCPDTDGDGIVDSKDKCPNEAGLEALNGCPDKDGDGVADRDDACPTVKGVPVLRGCPDTDGDGLADKDDKCPNDKGPMVSNGCPDSDSDGIADNEDKCPTVPGVAANNGCPATDLAPEVKTEVQNKLNFAAKNIEFETGSDRIRTVSYKDLDNVVAIMNQYKDLKVNIDGHTDNVGNETANVDLSMRRAVAVNNYLVKKGIAQNRLAASGFGPSKPIASNATAEGRQKNRRVELNIK